MSIKPTIFREYIGSQDGSKRKNFPIDIINKEVKEFHFILAFAKESYENEKGSGEFKASWDTNAFNVKSIENLKNITKAKVIVSIGGPKDVTLFNPDDRDAWLSKAKESLTKIINDYSIDGIDINYETILSSSEDFNFCIGGLIRHLKNENVITIASIAPSEALNRHYSSLFKAFKRYIDWVDYKFYGHHLPSKEKYIELYKKLSLDDYSEYLLAGFSTNANHAIFVSQGTFLDACQELIDTNLLPGIFVSDADYSKPRGYEVEKLAQNIIATINKNA